MPRPKCLQSVVAESAGEGGAREEIVGGEGRVVTGQPRLIGQGSPDVLGSQTT